MGAFGPLTPFLADQMHLSATQKGLLTAISLPGAASFFRPILGTSADRIGGRARGADGADVTLIPLVAGWHFATQLWQFYLIGFLLGVAGASFAVALPLAGRWYSAEHQGLAMGIAGAGNAGSLIATFWPAPCAALRLAMSFRARADSGCRRVRLLLRICQRQPGVVRPENKGGYVRLLRQADTWRLCFLYSLTFGGFSWDCPASSPSSFTISTI